MSIFIIDNGIISAQTDSLAKGSRIGIYSNAGASFESGYFCYDGGLFYTRSIFRVEADYCFIGGDRQKLPDLNFNESLVKQNSFSILGGVQDKEDKVGISLECGFGFGYGRFKTIDGSNLWNLSNINSWSGKDFKIFIVRINAQYEIIRNIDLCAGFKLNQDFARFSLSRYGSAESKYLLHEFDFQFGLRYSMIQF